MAYSFDGTNDSLEITKGAGATDLSSFTYVFWLKRPSVAGYRDVFWNGGSWSATYHTFLQYDTANYMALVANWTSAEARWSIPTPDTAWHLHIVSYDFGSSTNDPTWYLDGTAQTVTERVAPSGTADYAKDDGSLTIGAGDAGGYEYWSGEIAEFAMYSGILDSTARATIVSAGSPSAHSTGRVFYAPMSFNVKDVDGGNTATINGASQSAHPVAYIADNWSTSAQIQADHTKVSGASDLTNFPVLIKDGNIPASIYSAMLSTGADLRITTDSAGTTEIPFEIVSITPGSSLAEVWAKVPTLLTASATSLYLWAGNANAIAYDANAPFGSQAVWSDYRVVSHFQSSSLDSTSNARTATDTNTPTYTAGKIGNALTVVSASSQYISYPNAIINWGSNVLTLNVWFKLTSTTGTHAILMTARSGKGLNIYYDGTNLVFSKPNVADVSYAWTGKDTNWHKLTCIGRSGATYMEIYLDGATIATGANTATFVNPDSDTITVAGYKSVGSLQAGWYFGGQQDEFNIGTLTPTADWIATEYANQNDPSTFWTQVSGVRLLSLLGCGT